MTPVTFIYTSSIMITLIDVLLFVRRIYTTGEAPTMSAVACGTDNILCQPRDQAPFTKLC